jgi:hypothetical protein
MLGKQIPLDIFPVTDVSYVAGCTDRVLNPNGVRFGSAEYVPMLPLDTWTHRLLEPRICNGIFTIPDRGIEETICVRQKMNSSGDERVILLVEMNAGIRFTPQLRADIIKTVESKPSMRHVPAVITEVPEIVRALPPPLPKNTVA